MDPLIFTGIYLGVMFVAFLIVEYLNPQSAADKEMLKFFCMVWPIGLVGLISALLFEGLDRLAKYIVNKLRKPK